VTGRVASRIACFERSARRSGFRPVAAVNSWIVTKAGFFGKGKQATLTVFAVNGTARALIYHPFAHLPAPSEVLDAVA
jgi:hypothetical protein